MRKPNTKRVGDDWEKSDLNKYHKDQDARSQSRLYDHLFERKVMPREANHKYRPHRWRR